MTCRRCGGTGVVAVTGTYAEALALVREHPGENAARLGRLAGITGPAMANRLVALERLGLAVGRWHGRQRLWTARGGCRRPKGAVG